MAPIKHIITQTETGWPVTIAPEGWAQWTKEKQEVWLWNIFSCQPLSWHLVEKGISIRQPWGWAIIEAGKRLENRSRRMAAPGWYYVHVSATCEVEEYLASWGFIIKANPEAPHIPNRDDLPLGGIIGIMRITEWVSESTDPWYIGPKAAVIDVAVSLDFIPCKGSQGVFYPTFQP